MQTPFPAATSLHDARGDLGLAADFSRQVVGPYRKGIERMLARQVGPGDDLEDAVQEALASAFRTYSTIRDPKCLPAWVVQVAARVGAKQIQRRQRLRRATVVASPYAGLARGDLTDARATAETLLDLRRASDFLQKLDERHATAWFLRRVEGLSHEQIMAELDISRATSKRWIGEVDEALRDHLNAPAKG